MLNNNKDKSNNNDSDSSGDSDNEVDLDNLELLNYAEIRDICKQFGISAKGSKVVLVERIIQASLIKSGNNENNTDTGDKGCGSYSYSGSLISDENINDIEYGELVFWKVLKNKKLLNLIIGNLRKTSLTLKYSNLVDVLDMARNGKINLIKYKLEKNHHLDLVFANIESDYRSRPVRDKTFSDIYSKEKKDHQFYQLLFKRFHHHIISNLEANVLQAIKYDNVLVFQMLTEKPFNYQISNSTLIKSIQYSSVKSFRFILESNNNKNNYHYICELVEEELNRFNYSIKQCYNEINNSINSSPESTLFNICKKEISKPFLKFYKIIIMLIEEYSFNSIPFSLVRLLFNSMFTHCPFFLNFKLKHLLRACYLISILLNKYIGIDSFGNSYNFEINNVEDWRCEHVQEWLKLIKIDKQVIDTFSNQQMDGGALIELYSVLSDSNSGGIRGNSILNSLGLDNDNSKLYFQQALKQLLNQNYNRGIQNYFNLICNKKEFENHLNESLEDCKFGLEYIYVDTSKNKHYNNKASKTASKNIYQHLIVSKKQLESFTFTTEELNSDLKLFTNENSQVKKLMEMYLSMDINHLSKNVRYLIIFNSKSLQVYCNLPFKEHHSVLFQIFNYCLSFGNIELLNAFIRASPNLGSFFSKDIYSNYKFLLKFCPDETKQKVFIKSLLAGFLSRNSYFYFKTILPMIIQHDSLYLIAAIENFKEDQSTFSLGDIKSPSALKFILPKLMHSSLQLTKKWPLNMFKIYKSLKGENKLITNFEKDFHYNNNSTQLFILNDLKEFIMDDKISINCRGIINNESFQDSKHLVLTNNIQEFQNCGISNDHNNINSLVFIEWLSNNSQKFIEQFSKDLEYLYLIGKLDFNLYSIEDLCANKSELFQRIVIRNDIDMVIVIVKRYFNITAKELKSSKLRKPLEQLLLEIVKYNRLEILLAIHSKFSFILSKSSLNVEFITKLIQVVILNDYIDMWNFFINPNKDNTPIIPISDSLFRSKEGLLYTFYQNQLKNNINGSKDEKKNYDSKKRKRKSSNKNRKRRSIVIDDVSKDSGDENEDSSGED